MRMLRKLNEGALLSLGDAEVCDLRPAFRVDQDVLRLQITVNDPWMQVSQSVGDVFDDLQNAQIVRSIPLFPQELAEVFLHEFLHDVHVGARQGVPVQPHNILVVHLREVLHLLLEGFDEAPRIFPRVHLRVHDIHDLHGYGDVIPLGFEDRSVGAPAHELHQLQILAVDREHGVVVVVEVTHLQLALAETGLPSHPRAAHRPTDRDGESRGGQPCCDDDESDFPSCEGGGLAGIGEDFGTRVVHPQWVPLNQEAVAHLLLQIKQGGRQRARKLIVLEVEAGQAGEIGEAVGNGASQLVVVEPQQAEARTIPELLRNRPDQLVPLQQQRRELLQFSQSRWNLSSHLAMEAECRQFGQIADGFWQRSLRDDAHWGGDAADEIVHPLERSEPAGNVEGLVGADDGKDRPQLHLTLFKQGLCRHR
mmetsp:Transcript_18059/g.37210  ORF Transcript_18059/g.37210 Transcript_18059/m.37210 type:complete len:422 (+) Transcript_18059:449-1714(+)